MGPSEDEGEDEGLPGWKGTIIMSSVVAIFSSKLRLHHPQRLILSNAIAMSGVVWAGACQPCREPCHCPGVPRMYTVADSCTNYCGSVLKCVAVRTLIYQYIVP